MKPLILVFERSTKQFHIYNPKGHSVPCYYPKEFFENPNNPPAEMILKGQEIELRVA